MPNPKSFVDDEILSTSLKVFLKEGYSGASMRSLEKATKLSAGSIYFTFKNKKSLFLAVLNFYIEHVVVGRIAQYIENREFHDGLRAYFESTFTNETYDKCGCLLTIASTEAAMDVAISRKIREGFKIIQNKFLELVHAAQERGQVDRRKDPELLAQHLFTSYQGLLVLVRFRMDDTYLRNVAKAALANI